MDENIHQGRRKRLSSPLSLRAPTRNLRTERIKRESNEREHPSRQKEKT